MPHNFLFRGTIDLQSVYKYYIHTLLKLTKFSIFQNSLFLEREATLSRPKYCYFETVSHAYSPNFQNQPLGK
jgi:hypothetical protein